VLGLQVGGELLEAGVGEGEAGGELIALRNGLGALLAELLV
jgi:hypothetical protein